MATAEAATPPTGLLCIECESHAATVRCLDCGEPFCRPCVEALHRRGKRAEHRREAILGALMAAPEVSASDGVPGTPAAASQDAMRLATPEPEGNGAAPDSAAGADAGGAGEDVDASQYAFVPLRLTAEERNFLKILESALNVSEYTDNVDTMTRYRIGGRTIVEGVREIYAILTGLGVANRPGRAGERLVADSFSDNEELFRSVMEVGRRYKVMNPDKMRGTYGKLMYMLQDANTATVKDRTGVEPVSELQTVQTFLRDRGEGALELLRDARLPVACGEVIRAAGESREDLLRRVERKRAAAAALREAHCGAGAGAGADRGDGGGGGGAALSEGDVQRVLDSISDANNYVAYNVRPVERMLELLEANFDPGAPEKGFSLALSGRRGLGGGSFDRRYGSLGSRTHKLSHDHATQYTFVRQSLSLWVEIMRNMYRLWHCADADLLVSGGGSYSLWNTGQGLNRVQRCPNVAAEMRRILSRVQQRCGRWVGLSVVHLGDRDVPNALIFIDKYTQVPRMLAPVVQAVDAIERLMEEQEPVRLYVEGNWGDAQTLRMTILSDFFRGAFDGDGDDGGSCIDGRLTSCWNWCSRIEKKSYYHWMTISGFAGFDGEF